MTYLLCNCCSSNLVEWSNIDWLDFLVEFHDLVNEIINTDLVVLNDATNDKLFNTVGNWFLLVVLFPDETVNLDGLDLLEEFVEVGLSFVWLDFEEHDWLGNDGWLGLGLLSFFGFLLLLFKNSEFFLYT